MQNKKRILFVGEASFLATGFSTYYNEVIKRLYETDKFEIGEIGSYAHPEDPRIKNIPWKFWAVMPHSQDQISQQAYSSDIENQFGKSIFDQACLEFKPHIVVSIRDFWMDAFIDRSPYRKNFKWYWMLTIDGIPQKNLWLDTYQRTDGCLTYSKWGMEVMKKDGLPDTNLITVASPGVDLETFKPPVNKKDHKAKMGIDPNAIIIGTVMRNQQRKLYYDLIEAFSKWINRSKSKGHLELVKKTFLYLHTSYPDVGYDIGRAVREFNIGNKVVMTYLCNKCNLAYPSFFAGEVTSCRRCKSKNAHPPNANSSCSRQVLADIMKCFDLYVQYSICWKKGSKVLNCNYEYVPIENIKIGDKVITHDNKIQIVTKTFKNTTDKMCRIKIFGDYEEYYCTEDHPIWTQNGWKDASKLNNKDFVCLPIKPIIDHEISHDIDPYIVGVMIGDGWIGNNKRIGISLGYQKNSAIQAIKNYQPHCYSRDRNNQAIEFTWNDPEFVNKFSECLSHKAINKFIPKEYFNSSRQNLVKLIRGLFETDGSVNDKDIRFYSSSETLVKQVRSILLSLGITSSIGVHNRDENNKEYFIIIKSIKSKNKLLEILESVPIKERPDRREIFLKIQNGYLWSRVKSLNIIETKEDVYNIEVENAEGGDAQSSHSYVIGSIACHNCEGFG